jgi:hypothetical protein
LTFSSETRRRQKIGSENILFSDEYIIILFSAQSLRKCGSIGQRISLITLFDLDSFIVKWTLTPGGNETHICTELMGGSIKWGGDNTILVKIRISNIFIENKRKGGKLVNKEMCGIKYYNIFSRKSSADCRHTMGTKILKILNGSSRNPCYDF